MKINKINNSTFGMNKTEDTIKLLNNFNQKHILKHTTCDKAEIYHQNLWNEISKNCLQEQQISKKNNVLKDTSFFKKCIETLKKIF